LRTERWVDHIARREPRSQRAPRDNTVIQCKASNEDKTLSDGRVHDAVASVEVGGLETVLTLHERIDVGGSHGVLIAVVVDFDEVLLPGGEKPIAMHRLCFKQMHQYPRLIVPGDPRREWSARFENAHRSPNTIARKDVNQDAEIVQNMSGSCSGYMLGNLCDMVEACPDNRGGTYGRHVQANHTILAGISRDNQKWKLRHVLKTESVRGNGLFNPGAATEVAQERDEV
jgi:hypothetical protein